MSERNTNQVKHTQGYLHCQGESQTHVKERQSAGRERQFSSRQTRADSPRMSRRDVTLGKQTAGQKSHLSFVTNRLCLKLREPSASDLYILLMMTSIETFHLVSPACVLPLLGLRGKQIQSAYMNTIKYFSFSFTLIHYHDPYHNSKTLHL